MIRVSKYIKLLKGKIQLLAMIDEQAQTLLDNGFKGSLDQAIGNVIEKMNNQDYDLPLLTTAVEGSPIDVK